MFYISDDNWESMQNIDNRSKLLNELIKAHFESLTPMTNEQRLKKIAEYDLMLKHSKEMKELQNAN